MLNLIVPIIIIFVPATDSLQIIKLNRKFAYIVAGAFLFIAVFQLVFKHKHDVIITVIAVVLLALALIMPKWLTPLRIAWDKLGHMLGILNTYILLTVFYFLVLTPLGLLKRLFGGDILKLKRIANRESYWETATDMEQSKMENQF